MASLLHLVKGDEPAITIQIDYEPASYDPSRVFRAMARLIDAFQRIDRDLAASLSADVEPILILERVEAGSIRARLITVLRQINDDALTNLDWKPLVGQYLVRAKHLMLGWLEEHPTISNRSEVIELQQAILNEAPIAPPGQLLLPAPIPPAALIEDIRALSAGKAELHPEDSATLESDGITSPIEPPLNLSSDKVEELLTQEIVVSESELTLLVKKPDYLGNSRWEFKYSDGTIEARILHESWLRQFHAGQVVLKPGDALKAYVRSEVFRGFEGNIVSTKYSIVEVRGVVKDQEYRQGGLNLE